MTILNENTSFPFFSKNENVHKYSTTEKKKMSKRVKVVKYAKIRYKRCENVLLLIVN